MANIRVYRDVDANAVIISGTLIGMKFNNEIQAIGNGDTTIDLKNIPKEIASVDFDECTQILYSDFVDISDVQLGVTEAATVNALNAIFQVTGTPTGDLPVITSATTINITEGDSINYELIATNGVGYEWASLPTGVVNVEGNVRKIIGGTALTAAGSPYSPVMTAVNYNGSDVETLTINVASPPYNNTKSVKFNNNDYLEASATTSNPFYRAANGSGSPDAWTIAVWFKGGTSNDSEQTILSFGGNNENSEGRVWIKWNGSSERIEFEYGSKNSNLQLYTQDSSYPDQTWKHIIITYDGGTTDNDNYNRFEIWLDGVSQTTNDNEDDNGFDGELKDEVFKLGETAFGGDHLRNNCNIDEMAIWEGDETANVSAIYNSGTTHDLALLTSAPDHYWQMGDGDTFPTIEDKIASLDFTMNNMTAGDIVNDVP